jgi:hypothetical protein
MILGHPKLIIKWCLETLEWGFKIEIHLTPWLWFILGDPMSSTHWKNLIRICYHFTKQWWVNLRILKLINLKWQGKEKGIWKPDINLLRQYSIENVYTEPKLFQGDFFFDYSAVGHHFNSVRRTKYVLPASVGMISIIFNFSVRYNTLHTGAMTWSQEFCTLIF